MVLSHIQLPHYEQTKFSHKENGVVKAYAANTNQGLVRDYNEDRVSIVLNIQKPPQKKCDRWPKCAFFAIFDGHGGHTCADFLRDNLHHFIIRDPEFPQNPKAAIHNGFWKCELYFLETVEKFSAGKTMMLDKSGSCAIVALFVDELCFVANVGDSRAVMSMGGGRYTAAMSVDHKPNS
jgi:protein phosphatase 2C family protein 2/3